MRRLLFIGLASLLLAIVSFTSTHHRSEAAAPRNLSFGQTCAADGTVNLSVSWISDPSAREVWLDASTVSGDFDADGLMSEGPLSSRDTRHKLTGLQAHKVYWFRVNQLLPSGDWQPSVVTRYILGCGNAPAPTGSIQITGFTDGMGGTQTPPNGTLKSCNPERLIGYMRISGLTDITDITYVFYQGTTVIQRFPSAFDSSSTTWDVGTIKSGGYTEGPYRFEVWSGGDGTWKLSAAANFNLTCLVTNQGTR